MIMAVFERRQINYLVVPAMTSTKLFPDYLDVMHRIDTEITRVDVCRIVLLSVAHLPMI